MRKMIVTTAIAALALSAPALADQHGHDGMDDDVKHGGRMFDRLDANNDGKVDRLEIEQARDAHFARFDADGDGRVTEAEFEAGHAAMREQRRQARQARMFARHDADGDGVLTSEELPGQGMARMLERLDSDGDGTISRDEAAEHRGKMRGHGKGHKMRHRKHGGKAGDDG